VLYLFQNIGIGLQSSSDAQSTPNNVFPKSECAYVSETCLLNAPRGSI